MMNLPDFGSPAAQRIWALVSGYPSPKREARQLFMIHQAYVDESVSGGLLVMAGYISTVEKWAAFSDEWQKLLDMRSSHHPVIQEFHMTEMHGTPERLELCAWYYRLIEKYAVCAISCTINKTEFDELTKTYRWPSFLPPSPRDGIDNPWVQAFYRLTTAIALHKTALGLDGPIDFVFDETANKVQALSAWTKILEGAGMDGTASEFGETPIFRNSGTTLPLQAADFYAYWTREWRARGAKGRLPFPWKTHRHIISLDIYITGADFKSDWDYFVALKTLERSGIADARRIFPPRQTSLQYANVLYSGK